MASRITVIIPTLAQASRASALRTAIDSCLSQREAGVAVLVAINGTQYDNELRLDLERDARITTSYDPVGNLPRAIAEGRSRVRTQFFTFLDDDDYLLPGSLTERVARLAAAEDTDALVSNGYRYAAAESALILGDDQSLLETTADPLKALFSANWLASCGGVYRSASISTEFFQDTVQYCEWTYYAFMLASGYRIAFDPAARYMICDTEQSLSKTPYGRAAELLLWSKVAGLLDRRPDLTPRLWDRVADAHHACSEHFRHTGLTREAWKHHGLSLLVRRGIGLRYAFYTRHLIVDLFRRARVPTR
jgi:glycosyltransferase involved in cell wall biosynthesis